MLTVSDVQALIVITLGDAFVLNRRVRQQSSGYGEKGWKRLGSRSARLGWSSDATTAMRRPTGCRTRHAFLT
jgi:hypothetical protein